MCKVLVQDWLTGKTKQEPHFISGPSAVVWTRNYSRSHEENCKCDMLRDTLQQLSAERMVVGHTIQTKGVNGACEDQVVRCANSFRSAICSAAGAYLLLPSCLLCRRECAYCHCNAPVRGLTAVAVCIATRRCQAFLHVFARHNITTRGAILSCHMICRVDVGLSRGCYNAQPQALEIVQDQFMYRILADGSRVALNNAAKQAETSAPGNKVAVTAQVEKTFPVAAAAA